MSGQALRVAFFPDCYYEVDGVANTSRQFTAFAQRREYPMLAVHAAAENRDFQHGSVVHMERKRKWPSFYLDKNHDFDLLFWRYYDEVKTAVREFQPDVVHITGPSDLGIMGALAAHQLGIPLAASWHTNIHEYAELRAAKLLRGLPGSWSAALGEGIRKGSFAATARFYKIARILFAPNQELVELLGKSTNKPCTLMGRGVDTALFAAGKRDSDRASSPFTIGFVGRLTVEKNVCFLVELEQGLLASGLKDFRFLIVGQGALESWLRENLQNADFAGVLRGEALARAYANMDVFAFPSRTDTFGNVVLEALASGVPAVVTNEGGPKFIVRHGETGFIAADSAEFSAAVRRIAGRPALLLKMRKAARQSALAVSWDAVFESVYSAYERALYATGRPVRSLPARRRVPATPLAQ
jgi:phosphatidylinositol alpha 1,6-mannosyltransferase